jgi:adenosylmethionine-8-amino-7-oxononanoate aminotransferase
LRHGVSYSRHATAAAVALENLAIIEREGLLDEAARRETTQAKALAPLADHERVEEVRAGTGAVAAVQLREPTEAPAFAKQLRSFGVATRAVGAGGVQVSPAFVMTDEQVAELASAIGRALDAAPTR